MINFTHKDAQKWIKSRCIDHRVEIAALGDLLILLDLFKITNPSKSEIINSLLMEDL